jgi:hypothetical protein
VADKQRLTVVQMLPDLDAGGVERGTLEVAGALVRAGHRSVVISAGGRMVARLREEGSEHLECCRRGSPISPGGACPLHEHAS